MVILAAVNYVQIESSDFGRQLFSMLFQSLKYIFESKKLKGGFYRVKSIAIIHRLQQDQACCDRTQTLGVGVRLGCLPASRREQVRISSSMAWC